MQKQLSDLTGFNLLAFDPHLLPTVVKVTENFSSGQLIQMAKDVVNFDLANGKFSGDQGFQFNPKTFTVEDFEAVLINHKPFVGKQLDAFEVQ